MIKWKVEKLMKKCYSLLTKGLNLRHVEKIVIKIKLVFLTINLSAFISFVLSIILPFLLKFAEAYLDQEIVKYFYQFLLSYSCGYIIFFATVEFQRIRDFEAICPALFFWSFEYGRIKDLLIINYSGIPISTWNESNYESKVSAIKTLLSFKLKINEHYKDEFLKDLRRKSDQLNNINFQLIYFFPYLKNNVKNQLMNLLRNKGSDFLDLFYCSSEITTEINVDFTSNMIFDFITNIESLESNLSIATKPFLDIQGS